MFSPCFHMENLNPERALPPEKIFASAAVVLCLFALLSGQARAQGSGGYANTNSDSAPAASIQVTSPSNQSPYAGSVAQEPTNPKLVPPPSKDAIARGLKTTRGVFPKSNTTLAAGEK